MKVEITYIFHNCFVVQLPEHVLLFDYPADDYLNDEMRALVISKIKDTNLYIFASHNHPDHFNRTITELSSYAGSVRYLLSKDIIKKNRSLRENGLCFPLAPDSHYPLDDMEIRTFLSNDQGLAFLINVEHTGIYFGGDLANWQWDDLTPRETRTLVDYFGEVLAKLQQYPIQIAFSNMDPRLHNWSGAAQFMATVKPEFFVPMHTFGETGAIARFLTENPQPAQKFFHYRKTGDAIVLELPL